MIEVIHAIPGRVRFRVAGLKRDCRAAIYLQRELRVCEGIRQVAANPSTAKVLVRFAPGRTPGEIGRLIGRILAAATPEALAVCTPQAAPPGLSEEKALQPWHAVEVEEVLKHFRTSASRGLSRAAVEERRAFYGNNALPGAAARRPAEILKSQMTCLPVVLTAAAGVAVLTGGLGEGVLALAIALLNAAIGTVSEAAAERVLNQVRESMDLRVPVLRRGRIEEIPFAEVVPGDVLDLQPGTRVPADARLIRAEHLSVDEAALTGESLPVAKFAAVLPEESLPISRRANLLFRGTLVVEGSGRAVVVATGADTLLGRLQGFLGAVFPPEAMVARDIRMLSRRFLTLGLCAAGVFSLWGLLRGQGAAAVLRGALALVAGAMPSGLSTLSLGAFALGHRDLRRNGVLVRRLRALGNLGAAQVVCFDKTGTLTRNRMKVAAVFTGMKSIGPPAKDSTGAGLPEAFTQDPDAGWLLKLGMLCNEAYMVHEGAQSLEGSSTEKALILLAEQAGINSTAFRGDHPILEIRHRTADHHFMVTIHRWAPDRDLAVMKGSPLEVLERCAAYQANGESLPLGAADRGRIEAENFRMAGAGLRVLGLAFQWDPDPDLEAFSAHEGRLVWAGLVGLADPVRPGARELVEGLHRAGIRTAVITGDQSLTAHHIGAELGLAGGEPLRILDALDLNGGSPEVLRRVVTRTHVFARLNPTQKLQIIQAYQSAGLGVVMVGDGFNDILALKVADVGIAMGREGAELARRTADLVLEDDNLGNVLRAIADGRAFYGNMNRSLRFVLGATHVDVLADLMVRSGYGGQGPSALQSIVINLACLSLALDPAAVDGGEPPPPADRLLRPEEVERAVGDAVKVLAVGGLAGGWGLMSHGSGARSAELLWRSTAVNQLLYAFACREANGAVRRSPNLLRALFAALAGGHVLLACRAAGPARAAADILALGLCAWVSQRWTRPRPSGKDFQEGPAAAGLRLPFMANQGP